MRTFKNLKIGAKLLLSFGIITLILIVSMIIAILNMRTLSDNIKVIATESMPVTSAMWKGRRSMVAVERALYKATTSDDRAFTQEQVDLATKEFDTIINEVIPDMKKFLNSSDAEIQQVAEYENYLNTTLKARDQIFALVLLNKNDEALNLISTEFVPNFTAAGAILTNMANEVQAGSDAYSTTSINTSQIAIYLLLTFAIFNIVAAVIICIVITRSISSPVEELTEAARQMSLGSLNIDIKYDAKNELGILAESMRTTIKGIGDIVTDIDYLLGEMADGNFRIKSRCTDTYIGDYLPILTSLRNINQNLSSTLSQINSSADQVAAGSDQVSSGSQALSQGATEQASAVEELAATINEISNQVKQTAEHAKAASTSTNETGAAINGCNEQMQRLNTAMNEISEKSAEIGKIIKTIDDIAFQTNILALNAAVEAARAGAAGKGFAVVADEVRNLAGKSAEAAKSTTALIEDSVRAVENGTKIADETSRSLLMVVENSSNVTESVNMISIAASEQASNIGQVTHGVEQISSVVQTNSATAEESAAASEELSGQAQMLKSLVSRFTLREEDSVANAAKKANTPHGDFYAQKHDANSAGYEEYSAASAKY